MDRKKRGWNVNYQNRRQMSVASLYTDLTGFLWHFVALLLAFPQRLSERQVGLNTSNKMDHLPGFGIVLLGQICLSHPPPLAYWKVQQGSYQLTVLSKTTKLIIAWFTSTRGVCQQFCQRLVAQPVWATVRVSYNTLFAGLKKAHISKWAHCIM